MAVTRLTPAVRVFYEDEATIPPHATRAFDLGRTFLGNYAVTVEIDPPIRTVIEAYRFMPEYGKTVYRLGGWSPAPVKQFVKVLRNKLYGVNRVLVSNVTDSELHARVRVTGLAFDTMLEAATPGSYVTRFEEQPVVKKWSFHAPGDNRSTLLVIHPDEYLPLANPWVMLYVIQWPFGCGLRVWLCQWLNDELLPSQLACTFAGWLGLWTNLQLQIRPDADAIVISDGGCEGDFTVGIIGDARVLLVERQTG